MFYLPDALCTLLGLFLMAVYGSLDIPISYSVQFTSVAQSCPTPCDPMNCSMTGFPVLHDLR